MGSWFSRNGCAESDVRNGGFRSSGTGSGTAFVGQRHVSGENGVSGASNPPVGFPGNNTETAAEKELPGCGKRVLDCPKIVLGRFVRDVAAASSPALGSAWESPSKTSPMLPPARPRMPRHAHVENGSTKPQRGSSSNDVGSRNRDMDVAHIYHRILLACIY